MALAVTQTSIVAHLLVGWISAVFGARSHAFIHGTRAVLSTVKDKQDKLSLWTRTLIERRGYKRAAVALAAKNARILWAMMVKGETYQLKSV